VQKEVLNSWFEL